jgi:peptidoglycan/LPS O-acetylase OafA/YrhL
VTQGDARRISALDALRGIAALAVVFSHAIAKDAWPAWLADFTPLCAFRDGRSPVILFFVLSGLALTVSLGQTRSQGYLPFSARRICRIWLPFAAAIVLAAICCGVVDTRPDPNSGNAIYPLWSPDLPNPDAVLGTLTMLGRRKDIVLDNPVWSLAHELRISLIVPVLVFAQRRHSLEIIIAASALLGIVAFLYGSMWQDIVPLYGKTPGGSFEVTAYYAWFFCLGIATALHRDAVLAFAARHRVVLGILCLAFLSGHWPSQMLTDVFYGLGAMLLILAGDGHAAGLMPDDDAGFAMAGADIIQPLSHPFDRAADIALRTQGPDAVVANRPAPGRADRVRRRRTLHPLRGCAVNPALAAGGPPDRAVA